MTLNPEKSPALFTFLFCCWALGTVAALPIWDQYVILDGWKKVDALTAVREMRLLAEYAGDYYAVFWTFYRANCIRLLVLILGSVVVGRLTHWLLWGRGDAAGAELGAAGASDRPR